VVNQSGGTVVAGVCDDICITRDEVIVNNSRSSTLLTHVHSLDSFFSQATKRISVDMVVTPPEITVIQAALSTVSGWGLTNLKSGLVPFLAIADHA
jgi:hypothetical protein